MRPHSLKINSAVSISHLEDIGRAKDTAWTQLEPSTELGVMLGFQLVNDDGSSMDDEAGLIWCGHIPINTRQ